MELGNGKGRFGQTGVIFLSRYQEAPDEIPMMETQMTIRNEPKLQEHAQVSSSSVRGYGDPKNGFSLKTKQSDS